MGDLEVLAAAVFYAIHTIRLGVHAKSMSALELSTRVMIVSTVFTFGWAGYDYTTAALEGVISCPLSVAGLIGQWVPHRVFFEVTEVIFLAAECVAPVCSFLIVVFL